MKNLADYIIQKSIELGVSLCTVDRGRTLIIFEIEYANESSNLRRDSKIKKFIYLTTNNMENQQHF